MVFSLSTIFILVFDLSLDKELPKWSLIYMAFANFAYQTFDAVDGLHARAIKASSPLGQLFDHGIDALIHGIMITSQASVMRLGNKLIFFIYFHGIVVFTLMYPRFRSLQHIGSFIIMKLNILDTVLSDLLKVIHFYF